MSQPTFLPLTTYREYPPEEMKRRAADFYADLRRRRTVREFSDRPVPREIVGDCLRAAGTAPNGANMQPWHFVVVSDPDVKRRLRVEAEKEEYEFYHHKAPQEWLDALAPLGTDEHKPFLETAPRHRRHRHLRSELRRPPRRAQGEALLRAGVRGHCHRLPHRRPSPRRPGLAHPHPQPDGLSQRDPGPPRARAPVFDPRRRLPGGGGESARDQQEAAGRDCDVCVSNGDWRLEIGSWRRADATHNLLKQVSLFQPDVSTSELHGVSSGTRQSAPRMIFTSTRLAGSSPLTTLATRKVFCSHTVVYGLPVYTTITELA